jgi:hypothetical protein
MKKLVFLISLGFAFTALAENRQAAQYFETVELQEAVVHTSKAKSVDILIDYVIEKVDCHGVDFEYSVAQNKKTGLLYVEKRGRVRKALPCKPAPLKDAQAGLKLTIKNENGSGSITRTLLVPKNVKVEFVVNE